MKIKYLVLLSMLASCAPTIKNFDKYQKQFLNKSQFLPSEEALADKPAKIVVFPLIENENQIATQAALGITIANDIENILSQYRLGQLVDRSAAKKLEKEIQLAEMNKTGSYKGPQVGDYAISGSVSNAGFTKKYSDGYMFINPKTGAATSIPPKFTYASDVSGNLKIYELPSMIVVDNIEFKGSASRQEDVQQNGGFSLGAMRIGGEQAKGSDRDDNLVRKAGQNAIKRTIVDLRNALAQKGYVLEKRILDKKTIFKISLGSSHGIKHGDKFEIIGQYEVENPITSKVEIERNVIANGAVTDKIDPKTCWIVLDDKEKESQIRLGDIVKMKYKRGIFDSLNSI